MKAKQFSIKIVEEEHPSCFEKGCGAEHMIRYLVIVTDAGSHYFREGHPVYKVLKNYVVEKPNIFENIRTITVEAYCQGEYLAFQSMIHQMEKEIGEREIKVEFSKKDN